jgi:hypothetical protein
MNASHGPGVKCLHQKRSHAGDNNGNPAVDVPDRRAWTKVTSIIALGDAVDPLWFAVGVTGEHGE